ncbi:MAG: alpha/beta hydrolase [Stenotrophobium sp.]
MNYELKPVKISTRSRIIVWLLRKFLRPWLGWVVRGPLERIARAQLLTASRMCRDSSGLALEYRVIGGAGGGVPGHVLGDLADARKPVILYLHGGAFILPASPDVHVRMLAKMCRALDAVGFMADYRLAPANKFPAALDDCERAYRALLDLGFQASRIAVAGESAGGNLTLGLLQRIRRHGLPMPACAVPISPATEMSRLHGMPSRTLRMRRDPLLPIASLSRVNELYVGARDAADPELSPLYADLSGFPPLYLLASDNEILRDDTVLFVQRAREAGVATRMDIWPTLPHAFPLFEMMFPEAREAREDIVGFMKQHIG